MMKVSNPLKIKDLYCFIAARKGSYVDKARDHCTQVGGFWELILGCGSNAHE
jgi:hypothetical protein